MPKKTETRVPFNLQLNISEKHMLQELVKQKGTSGGAILRQALRLVYNHEIKQIPFCASGQPCMVPQMHLSARPAMSPQQIQMPQPEG